ncbi:hypothetical protein NVP1250O_59 [Vibrio phage 1.250.O._10N.261.55.E11]|nr:hypothetical protein NVP1250O_59 [Vibrio phage 1.250.O._10N.261.55.E11]
MKTKITGTFSGPSDIEELSKQMLTNNVTGVVSAGAIATFHFGAGETRADTICNMLDQASAKVTAARFDTASGRIPAHAFLEKGAGHMKDRASQRDAEDGERSMKRCVEAFNALEGTALTETQGWKFMVMLKMSRSVSGDFTADDYEDMAAYAGLAGESASMENPTSDK